MAKKKKTHKLASGDLVTVNSSIAKVRKAAAEDSLEPFLLAVSNSKVVAFPSLTDLPVDASFEVTRMVSEAGDKRLPDLGRLFDLWLSKEDRELLRAENLTLTEAARLFEKLMTYFESQVTGAGE